MEVTSEVVRMCPYKESSPALSPSTEDTVTRWLSARQAENPPQKTALPDSGLGLLQDEEKINSYTQATPSVACHQDSLR